jgi:hypothetical protein
MQAQRDHGMDALRTLAVIAMMASHTARLISFDLRPAWAQMVLLLEPITPTLFLLLVGLSLARSYERFHHKAYERGQVADTSAWYLRQLRRAGILWLISGVFFTLELGFRLPDVITASGILATIAYAIVVIGGLLAMPTGTLPRWLPLLSVWLVGVALFLWIDATGRGIFILTTGNSPLLPLCLFALTGALWGRFFTSNPSAFPAAPSSTPRWLAPVLGISLVLIALALIARYGLEPLFSKPLGRSDAGRLVPAPFYGGGTTYLGYYNLRPVLALASLGIQLGCLVILGGLFLKLPERAAAFGFALGRDALVAYILHLALLGVLVVATGERQPLTEAWQVSAVWVTLIVTCMIFARWRKSRGRKHVE